MRSWIAGRRPGRREAPVEPAPVLAPPAPEPDPLTTVRVSTSGPAVPRSFGRREEDFAFDRVFVPSLIIDHTELVLRQAGSCSEEGFVLWAGTLAGNHAHVSSLVVPTISAGARHGEVSADSTARILTGLDERDLVPIAQLHTHPREAFLSPTDRIRPLVAVPGFFSIVIPNFGFVDLADVTLWSAHEFGGGNKWRELDRDEQIRRFIVDDSVIRVD